MQVETLNSSFRKVFPGTAYSTGTAYAASVPTTTEPTGNGVIQPRLNDLMLMPYSKGADNGSTAMRVIGWSGVSDSGAKLYIPVFINEYFVTAGTTVGVASAAVGTADRFCDTVAAGTTGDTVHRYSSPANNLPGFVVVSRNAFEYVEIAFSGTGFNALYAEM